jgi:hypothetical protein
LLLYLRLTVDTALWVHDLSKLHIHIPIVLSIWHWQGYAHWKSSDSENVGWAVAMMVESAVVCGSIVVVAQIVVAEGVFVGAVGFQLGLVAVVDVEVGRVER